MLWEIVQMVEDSTLQKQTNQQHVQGATQRLKALPGMMKASIETATTNILQKTTQKRYPKLWEQQTKDRGKQFQAALWHVSDLVWAGVTYDCWSSKQWRERRRNKRVLDSCNGSAGRKNRSLWMSCAAAGFVMSSHPCEAWHIILHTSTSTISVYKKIRPTRYACAAW